MLTGTLAHARLPAAPHDAIADWNIALLAAGATLMIVVAGSGSGSPFGSGRRRRFLIGSAAALLAVASPLEAAAGSLMSAHMIQHVALVMVAAPLLAASRPWRLLSQRLPIRWQRAGWALLRVVRVDPRRLRGWTNPAVIWLAYVGTWWFWHASRPYQAAVEQPLIHVVEHLGLIVTAMAFWHIALGIGWRPPNAGFRILYLFTAAMTGVLLAALITFSGSPWYEVYSETQSWGIDPLTDQQLAGLIMWIPTGLIYTGMALHIAMGWLKNTDGGQSLSGSAGSTGRPSGRWDSAPGPAGRDPDG